MTSLWTRFCPVFVLAAALAAVDGFARLTFTGRQYVERPPLSWFVATAEGSLPTLFSVATMAAVGIGCFRQQEAPRACWRLLGVFCCYLAVDDLLGVHEAVGELAHPWVGGHGVYAWVIVLAPVFALLGLVCGARLWRALAADAARRRCLVGGFAMLAVAITLEAGEHAAGASAWRLRGIPLLAWTQWCEETLELLGPVLLLAATWPRAMSAVPAATA